MNTYLNKSKWIEHNGFSFEVSTNSTGTVLTSYLPYYWKCYNGYSWFEMLEMFTQDLKEMEEAA